MKVFILTRKRLAVLGTALVVLFCVGIFGTVNNDDAVAASTTQRSIPIYCVETDEKKVSISFDAAWGNEQTQTLLDTLEEYDVKSTFFLVGDWVRNYPDDVKAIAEAGHDVGNHSDTHPYMTQLDSATMAKELENCNSEIEAITGKCPTLFRPPYGDYDDTVVNTVTGMNMYCVQWDVDSLDWKNLTAEEMCSRVRNNIKNGSIILMHNGAENTPEALPMIIECIKELGYEIVPISELLPKGEYTTDHTGMMIPSTDSASKTDSSATSSKATSEKTDSDSEQTRQTAAEVDAVVTSDGTESIVTDADTVNSQTTTESVVSSAVSSNTQNTTSATQGLQGELNAIVNGSNKK